jgi:predicted nucleic-acid-binding protein
VIAVDTNILVRFYVDPVNSGENDVQQRKTIALFKAEAALYVPITVILEFAWVMQSFYEFSAENLRGALAHLTGLPNVEVERWSDVNTAAQLNCQGLDFADALHALLTSHADEFVTFDDKSFVRRAKRLGVLPHVRLL